MDKINPVHYAAIGLAVAGVIFIILIFLLKRKNTCLSNQLIQMTTMLEITRKRLTKLQEKHDKTIEFQNSLNTAKLTTMLQKPRLNARKNASGNALSGKYSSIRSLTQKGMSVDEIALVLAISTHEAQQLINLSNLAQGNSAGKITD